MSAQPPSGSTTDPLEASALGTLSGLPEVGALGAHEFAAQPKKKISALWTKADGKSCDGLRARLAPLTNCASYLVCVGSLHVAVRRSEAVIEPKLMVCLAEAVFAYQLDWRYPKPFGITMSGLDAATPDVALRRAFAHAFFPLLEMCPSYFFSGSAQPTATYMITLTRHLLGKQVAAYDAWPDALIVRLHELATNPEPEARSAIFDYPSRDAWEVATRVRHGRPLPLELLDLDRAVPPLDTWPSLVAAGLTRLSPAKNPLLQPKKRSSSSGCRHPTPSNSSGRPISSSL